MEQSTLEQTPQPISSDDLSLNQTHSIKSDSAATPEPNQIQLIEDLKSKLGSFNLSTLDNFPIDKQLLILQTLYSSSIQKLKIPEDVYPEKLDGKNRLVLSNGLTLNHDGTAVLSKKFIKEQQKGDSERLVDKAFMSGDAEEFIEQLPDEVLDSLSDSQINQIQKISQILPK